MINAQEKEVELICCSECNWNCDYCCVDTHSLPDISNKLILRKLKLIKEKYQGYNITLSGGEVGTMSKEDILLITDYLDELKCSISLNTNGLFLKKYPELAHKFDYVLYHCSEDLITKPDYNAVFRFNANVEYMIVVSDNNINNLDKFLTDNACTTFHLVAATQPQGGLEVTLSNKNRYKIMKKQYRNISQESLKRLIIKEKEFDSIIYI